MKKNSLEYWEDEVENGLSDIEGGQNRIGRALWKLHGPKGQKKNQLWKNSPHAEGLNKFTDYCIRRFPCMSWRHAYRHMAAYEAIELQKQDEEAAREEAARKEIDPLGQSAPGDGQMQTTCNNQPPITGSPIPQSERVLRPLTKLKTEADKKRAWRIANENKKGERVTSKDMANAVKEVQIANVHGDQRAKQMAKEIQHEVRTEHELRQYAEEGISTLDAFKKVHISWTALIKDEDDERAILKLANVYIEYLTDKYTIDS